ncbi:MAG: hypothetical protein WC602_05830 [archaeon]
MKSFIAILGAGKGSWGHIARLISEQEWKQIFLVSNDWGKEHFDPSKVTKKEVEWILMNNRAGFDILKDTIKEKLPKDELAVSLASGSGKEHMALIAALKEKGSKYEFVTLTGDGTKFF